MKNKIYIIFLSLTTMAGLVLVVGCATTAVQTLSPKIESEAGNAIRISSVQVKSSEDGILVSGGIVRNLPYSVPRGAHLHVIAINAKDQTIGNEVSTINPHMLQHGHRGNSTPAMYALQIPVAPQSVSKVKVVYHDHHHSDCNEKCSKS